MSSSIRLKVGILIFVYSFGYAAISPIFPQLLLTCFDGNDSKASSLNGVLWGLSNLLQFLLLPGLTALVDHVGSKILLLCSFGFGAVIFFILTIFIENIICVSVVFVLSGLTFVNIYIFNAMMGQTSTESKSVSHDFGIITAILGLVLVIAPLLGTTLGTLDPRYVSGVSVLSNVIAFVFLLCCSWEDTSKTVDPLEKKTKLWSKIQPWKVLSIFFRHRQILWLAFAYLFFDVSGGVINSLYILLDYRYGWSPVHVGVYISVFGLATMLSQTVLLRIFVPVKVSEMTALRCCLCFQCVGWILQALSVKGWMFFLTILVVVPHLCFEPCMLGQLSQLVPKSEQGSLQGAVASLRTLTMVVSEPMYGFVFSACTSKAFKSKFGQALPSSPLLLASLYSLIGFAAIFHASTQSTPKTIPLDLESTADSLTTPLVGVPTSEVIPCSQSSAPDS